MFPLLTCPSSQPSANSAPKAFLQSHTIILLQLTLIPSPLPCTNAQSLPDPHGLPYHLPYPCTQNRCLSTFTDTVGFSLPWKHQLLCLCSPFCCTSPCSSMASIPQVPPQDLFPCSTFDHHASSSFRLLWLKCCYSEDLFMQLSSHSNTLPHPYLVSCCLGCV